MALSTDINLPKSKTPMFPDACVVCGADSPNNTVKVGTNSIGWWTVLTWWFGKRFSVRVPACKSCAIKLQIRRWGALLAFILIATIILFIIGPLVTPHVPASMRKWALMISLLVCLSPFFLWETLFPPAFELTAYSDTVDYEFRNETYAVHFGLLNRFDWDSDPEQNAEDENDGNRFPNITT